MMPCTESSGALAPPSDEAVRGVHLGVHRYAPILLTKFRDLVTRRRRSRPSTRSWYRYELFDRLGRVRGFCGSRIGQ